MARYICPGCDGTGTQHSEFPVGLGNVGLAAMIGSTAFDLGGGLVGGLGFDGNGFTPTYVEKEIVNFTCTICGGCGYVNQ
jgi:hypothetical protein